MLAFILLQLIPAGIGAILLWCFGKYIAKCPGTLRCMLVSVVVSVSALASSWGIVVLVRTLTEGDPSVLLLWCPYLAVSLLVSWIGLRYGYTGEEGNHLSWCKSLVLSIVFTIVQVGASFGAGLIWVVDFMTFKLI